MNQTNADNGILVVTQTEEGFTVYSPQAPKVTYLVAGTPDAPTCTCQEFTVNQGTAGYRCPHIQAVFKEMGNGEISGFSPASAQDSELHLSSAQMMIKRSVSPDGKIDSLSVEFNCPVDDSSRDEVKNRAQNVLTLQSEIVSVFLQQGNPLSNGQPQSGNPGNDGTIIAQMHNVSGMQTRWGWRFFINIGVNGKSIKLFGDKKKLGEYIAAAGYPDLSYNLTNGTQLNIPCRVITKPSDDGKYLNVEQVFPLNGNAVQGGR